MPSMDERTIKTPSVFSILVTSTHIFAGSSRTSVDLDQEMNASHCRQVPHCAARRRRCGSLPASLELQCTRGIPTLWFMGRKSSFDVLKSYLEARGSFTAEEFAFL